MYMNTLKSIYKRLSLLIVTENKEICSLCFYNFYDIIYVTFCNFSVENLTQTRIRICKNFVLTS